MEISKKWISGKKGNWLLGKMVFGEMDIGKNRDLEELKFGKMDFQKILIWKNANLEKCKFGKMQIRKNAN